MPLFAHDRIQRVGAVAAAFAALVFLAWAYTAYLRAPAVGTFHDDGVYLVTAKALATGRGYRIVSLPGEPRQTKYPILLPWLLSLVWRIAPAFPDNIVWLRLVPLSAAVVWLCLSWRLVRRLGGTTLAAGFAVLLAAISPWTLYLATTTLSETLFAALLTGSVLMLTRAVSETRRRFDAPLAGVLAGLAVLTRAAGVAAAAGGLAALVVRRRWSGAVAYAVAVAAVALPWLVWSARHGAEPIVDPFYAGSNYTSWTILFHFPWPEKLAVFAVNFVWATQFGQYWGLAILTWPAWAAALIATAFAARGFVVERSSPAAIVSAVYLASLLVFAFPPMRFIVPILPLLVWLTFTGAGRLQPVVAIAAAAVVLTSGAAMRRQVNATLDRGGTWIDAGLVDDWRAMRAQYDWISTNTPAGAVFVATHDPTVYLFTGRHAVRPSTPDPIMLHYNVGGRPPDIVADVEHLRQRILDVGADYLVVTPRDDGRVLDRFEAEYAAALSTVHTAAPKFAILHVDRSLLGRLHGQ